MLIKVFAFAPAPLKLQYSYKSLFTKTLPGSKSAYKPDTLLSHSSRLEFLKLILTNL
jgi:hypothetical protein